MASMIYDYKNAFRSFNRNVRLMLVYYAMNAVANGIVAVLLNLYFLKLGLDENFLGSAVFAQSLGLALFVLPFGMLADRLPKHTLVKAAFLVMNLPFAAFLVSENPTFLVTMFAVQSVGIAVAVGSEFPYLTENVAPEARTHLFSINMAVYTAGPALGMAVAGYLPKVLGPLVGAGAESASAYRLALFVAVALFYASGLAVCRIKKSPNAEHHEPRAVSLKFSKPGTVLGLGLNASFVALAASLFVPFANVIMNQRFQMPAHVIGWVFTVLNIAISLGALLVPRLGEKRGKLAGATMLQMMALPAYIMLALAPNATIFVIGYILRGTMANMPAPLIDSYTMDAVTPGERGTASATLNLARNLLWAIGGKIGGAYLQQKMFPLPMVFACVSYGLAIVVFAVMLRIPHMRDRATSCGEALAELSELADAQ